MLGRNRFQIKTPDQIRTMRRAGLVVAEGLEAMSVVAVPGATTADIDRVGREASNGTVPGRTSSTTETLGAYRPTQVSPV